ncbi:MAG: phosphatase PAP2 family protein [Actinobacteria bacterium]|nr:phosphatase PAP2 family protein [Actinomycetota bacterium]
MEDGLPEAVASKLSPAERYGLRQTLLVVAVALVGVPFGLLLQQVTREGPLTRVDTSLAEWLHERVRDSASLTAVMKTLSFVGRPTFLVPLVALTTLWCVRSGARKLAAFLILTSLGGGAVDTIVKILVSRPRPSFDDPIATALGKSFPSGHAMSSTICYGAVVLVVLPLVAARWRPVLIAAVSLLVLGIGVSRLALGVHFLSDVLGGFVLGGAWLVGSVAVFEVWRVERGKPKTHPATEGVEPEEAKTLTD